MPRPGRCSPASARRGPWPRPRCGLAWAMALGPRTGRGHRVLHEGQRVGVTEKPALDQAGDKQVHVADGRADPSASPALRDGPLGRLSRAGRHDLGSRQPEGRARDVMPEVVAGHAEGAEDPVLVDLGERQALDRLDHQAEKRVTGVAACPPARLVRGKEWLAGVVMRGGAGNGRSERIRTSDPLLPKQVRYQTALRSDRGGGVTPSAGLWQGASRLIARPLEALQPA